MAQQENVSLQIDVELDENIYLIFKATVNDYTFETNIHASGGGGHAPTFRILRENGILTFTDEDTDELAVRVNINQREIVLKDNIHVGKISDVPESIIQALNNHCLIHNDVFSSNNDVFRASANSLNTRIIILPLEEANNIRNIHQRNRRQRRKQKSRRQKQSRRRRKSRKS